MSTVDRVGLGRQPHPTDGIFSTLTCTQAQHTAFYNTYPLKLTRSMQDYSKQLYKQQIHEVRGTELKEGWGPAKTPEGEASIA